MLVTPNRASSPHCFGKLIYLFSGKILPLKQSSTSTQVCVLILLPTDVFNCIFSQNESRFFLLFLPVFLTSQDPFVLILKPPSLRLIMPPNLESSLDSVIINVCPFCGSLYEMFFKRRVTRSEEYSFLPQEFLLN